MSKVKFQNLWLLKGRPTFLIWFSYWDTRILELEDNEGSILITIFNFCWIINPKEE